MKFKTFVLGIIAILTLYGCPSPKGGDNGNKYDDVRHSASYAATPSADSTGVGITSEDDTENTSSVDYSGDKIQLVAKVTNIISPIQIFRFSSVPIKGSTISTVLNENKLEINLEEGGWNWKSLYTLKEEFSGEVFPGYTVYKTTASDAKGKLVNIEFKINKNNEVQYLKVDNRRFSNTPDVAPTSSTTSLLKELNAGEIEVRKGETLRVLVDKYNKQFNTNYTVERIVQFNQMSSNTVRVGDVIKFPQQ